MSTYNACPTKMNIGSGRDKVFVTLLSLGCRVAAGPGIGLEIRQGVGKERGHRVLHEGVPQGAGQLQNGGSGCRCQLMSYYSRACENQRLSAKPVPIILTVLILHSACCVVTTGVGSGTQQFTVRGWSEEDKHEDQRGRRAAVVAVGCSFISPQLERAKASTPCQPPMQVGTASEAFVRAQGPFYCCRLYVREPSANLNLHLFFCLYDLQSSGQADSERAAHAMADPEIQAILTDPMVRQVLTDFKENPQHAQKVS